MADRRIHMVGEVTSDQIGRRWPVARDGAPDFRILAKCDLASLGVDVLAGDDARCDFVQPALGVGLPVEVA